MEVVYAMRDLGVPASAAGDAVDDRIRAALSREINRAMTDEGNEHWLARQRRRAIAWMLGTRQRWGCGCGRIRAVGAVVPRISEQPLCHQPGTDRVPAGIDAGPIKHHPPWDYLSAWCWRL
jgi:hypothetical protein